MHRVMPKATSLAVTGLPFSPLHTGADREGPLGVVVVVLAEVGGQVGDQDHLLGLRVVLVLRQRPGDQTTHDRRGVGVVDLARVDRGGQTGEGQHRDDAALLGAGDGDRALGRWGPGRCRWRPRLKSLPWVSPGRCCCRCRRTRPGPAARPRRGRPTESSISCTRLSLTVRPGERSPSGAPGPAARSARPRPCSPQNQRNMRRTIAVGYRPDNKWISDPEIRSSE